MSEEAAVDGLRHFLEHKKSLDPKNNPDSLDGFAKEFQKIKELSSKLKKDKAYPTYHGERDVNRSKNRYKDILPFDYTRIVLPEVKGVEGSDYINGNYIKNPSNEVAYLAAQGPLPRTVDDFWRMIISHKIQVVVMACREYEMGKLKCKRYWPANKEEELSFAGAKITLISIDSMADGFVIRTLKASTGKEDHMVTQFHYTAWPDHDVPRSPTPLIELTRSFRTFVGDQNVPVLVHCSAGCGRTGTICALDYAWTLMKNGQTKDLSVFEIVTLLRRRRVAMVQTKEQYALVYKAVEELVHNELRKRRLSQHVYVNVEVGDKSPKTTEPTYENIAFIQSIQRLHQEEKRAIRRPLPEERPKKSSPKSLVEDETKENIIETTFQLTKPPVAARKGMNVTIGKKGPGNDSDLDAKPVKPVSAKPVKPAKPVGYTKQMSYPVGSQETKALSDAQMHALDFVAPQPQSSQVRDLDYVIPPQGTKHGESDYVVSPVTSGSESARKPQPIAEALLIDFDSPTPQTTVPSTCSLPSKYENVVVPRQIPKAKPEEKLTDFQADQSSNGHSPGLNKPEIRGRRKSEDTPQLPDGIRTKRSDPRLPNKTNSPPSSEMPGSTYVRCKSEDKPSLPDGIRIKRSDPVMQGKTSSPSFPSYDKQGVSPNSGMYSLIGALDPPPSPRGTKTNPFTKEETNPFRQGVVEFPPAGIHFGFGDEVVADNEGPSVANKSDNNSTKGLDKNVKLSTSEKPSVAPRRTSESTKCKSSPTLPQQGAFVGSYSLVTFPEQRKLPESKSSENLLSNNKQAPQNVDVYSSISKEKAKSSPNLLCEESEVISGRKLVNGSVDPLTKTEMSERRSVESDISSYGLVTARRRKSEEVLSGEDRLSPLYSRPDSDGPVRHKPLALRRSNSGGILHVHSQPAGDLDSMYATVGARPREVRKRVPIPSDLWTSSASDSHPSTAVSMDNRKAMRSQNSSSSLKSTTSMSSDDTEEELPPIPIKTAGAFVSLDEDEPYENVQGSSPRGTLDRFKAKARAQLIKTRQGGTSPAHTPRSGSPVEGITSATDHLGYGRRVGKPLGPRDLPDKWPSFASVKAT